MAKFVSFDGQNYYDADDILAIIHEQTTGFCKIHFKHSEKTISYEMTPEQVISKINNPSEGSKG